MKKIPKSLDSYVKKHLGITLTAILKKNQTHTLKRKLNVNLEVVPETHLLCTTLRGITLNEGTVIRIALPKDHLFQPINYTNTIHFQLECMAFKRVNFRVHDGVLSHFEAEIKNFVEALKE